MKASVAGQKNAATDAAGRRCGCCNYELGELSRCPECGLTAEEAAPHALRRRRWRENRKACFLVVGAVLGLLGPVVAWLFMPNLGLPFGYYGRYNRTVWAIEGVPGVTLGQANANHDVTIEEILVSLRLATGERVRMFISQDVDLRNTPVVLICSLDDEEIGSKGEARSWSGLMLTMGKDGSLSRVTDGRAKTVVEMLEHFDLVRAWIESSDLEELRAEFEPDVMPRGGVWMWVGKRQ